MNDLEAKKQAKSFAEYWKDKGYEKGESQKFWIDLLEHVLGVPNARDYISFEDQVKLDHTSFIDGFIPATKVLIEQKSSTVNLNSGIKQSDGSLLTPYQQALKYNNQQVYSKKARWIITCNFKEFYIYDMEKSNPSPEIIQLKDLPKEYYRLEFIVNKENENIKKEMEISIKAGEIVGHLYDALLKQYSKKNDEELKSLNELCVRLVFCLYAEDSGLFGQKRAFHNYLQGFAIKDTRRALIELFKVLDTKIEDRDDYLDEELSKFPYVNGGLFANENIIIPQITQEIMDIILHKASEDFDWSLISPTIFGAVFESTLNPETRRSGGMHFTPIENIHKVIDPLFLDDLKEELEKIKEVKVEKSRKQQLEAYRDKLSKLTFLDPACGSGNFLTETYISLRKLENEALALEINSTKKIVDNQIIMGFEDTIKVSIGQFYGIEINDFAVTVAKTALWISESQMMKETETIVNRQLEFFPLKSYANIVEGNALQIDWNEVVPKEKLSFIMGNPPFVGARLMTKEQKQDCVSCYKTLIQKNQLNANELDFVASWYLKSAYFIINTKIKCAFVSTNSITQGEQVAILWKPLLEHGIEIDFAHRTFIWDSEASLKAHVYCVIIGFSYLGGKEKFIYDNGQITKVEHINPYLIEAEDVLINKRSKPLNENITKMIFGSMPNDGGHLILDSNEQEYIKNKYQGKADKFIKPLIGAHEFINRKVRYCLWLDNKLYNEIKNYDEIYRRVLKVKELRENSNRESTRDLALYPYSFGEIRQPESTYLLFPCHSSEARRYIPIGFIDKDTICTNSCLIVPNATLYDFGVLTSNVHNAWTRTVCGRLEMRYRYSASIVYNNFPWPKPNDKQKENIEKTAQMILDARNLYPDWTFADLYNEVLMPKELRKAHQLNDKAVMEAYGFWGKVNTESECVAELMKMYQNLTKEK